ncbi:unnamed protein product [Schistosoma rodhaini]|uniref:Ricin B-type lectin domain-containing protein n=1 Tax=Schistosoma rodhaini TaxID=6188 RepID=A0AA85FJP3_9TREM|nr:unnamed protein product [Schistosoma rodhaini]
MVMDSEISFPARQLFTCSSNCTMDKTLLTKKRQQEADNAIRSSTEQFQRMYDINTNYFTPNYASKTPSFISDHTQFNGTAKNLPKCSSTPAFATENNDTKSSNSCDHWQWELISSKNQYIPSFYLGKQYYSDTCVTINQYDSTQVLQTPIKQIHCAKANKVKKGTNELLVSQHSNLLKTNMESSKKNKLISTKINSWNLPVKKWPQNLTHTVKQTPLNHVLARSYSLTTLNTSTLNKLTASKSIISQKTMNSLEELPVIESAPFNSYTKYGIGKHETLENRKIAYPITKYKQTTLLEILPKWREQAAKLHLSKQTIS